ncbi:MAG TPA: aldehyde dehydrogenase family protein, partial [Chloroflexota bacterium]
IVQSEIFGPVVAVMKIRDLDHALELIRGQAVGNGACIFTQSLYYTERFIAEADVGMVGVNVGVPAPHPYLPFGGIKQSLVGTDKAQGKGGFDFFTQAKVATIRSAPPAEGRHGAAAGRDVVPQTAAVKSCTAS